MQINHFSKNVVCNIFIGSKSNQKKVRVGVSLGFSNCAKLLPSQSHRVLGASDIGKNASLSVEAWDQRVTRGQDLTPSPPSGVNSRTHPRLAFK